MVRVLQKWQGYIAKPLSEITRRMYNIINTHSVIVSVTCMQVPNETGSGERSSKSPLCSVGMSDNDHVIFCCRCSMENSHNSK